MMNQSATNITKNKIKVNENYSLLKIIFLLYTVQIFQILNIFYLNLKELYMTYLSKITFKKKLLLTLISANLSFSAVASANSNSEAKAESDLEITETSSETSSQSPSKNREVMVVTASGFEQEIRDASANISIVTQETLQKEQINNLADAVKHIEGISIIGSNVNSEDISIRGLPGAYTLILIDGKRVNTRDSRPNGSGGFEAGFMPPVSAIDRIEVVQGPMSSLYGSDAVGGVINIITKKSDDNWHGSISLDSTLYEKSKYGNRYKESIYASGPLVEDKLFIQLYAKHDKKDEDDFSTGQYGNKNWDVGSKITYKPAENQNIYLDLGRSSQQREHTLGKTDTSTGTTINTRNSIGLSYDGYWDSFSTELAVYQENTKRETTTDDVYSARKPEIKNTVVDAKAIFDLEIQTLSVGGQYQRNSLSDTSVVSSLNGAAVSEEQTNTIYQKALFLEDEIKIIEDLYATLGVRMDHHSEYGTHYNPRAYLVYNLNSNWTVKGGIAKAYRTPSIREISPNYGTATGRGKAVMYGNPDLNPETAVTEEFSILYENEAQLRGSLTLFNTDFKNKIANENSGETDPKTGLQLYKYYNIGKATIRGIEASVQFPIIKPVKLHLNYAYLHSERKSDDGSYSNGQSMKGEPLAQTPKNKVNAKLDWQVTDDLSSYLQATYTGKQIWSDIRNGSSKGARTQSAYTIVDLGASYQVTETVQINGSINNLLNKQLDTTTDKNGDWTSIDGRNLWVGVNIGF